MLAFIFGLFILFVFFGLYFLVWIENNQRMIRRKALNLKRCVSYLLKLLHRGYSSILSFLRIYFGAHNKKYAKEYRENASSDEKRFQPRRSQSLSVTSLDLIVRTDE